MGDAAGEAQARFGGASIRCVRLRRQQRGFDHRPQHAEAGVFVLQRGHRGEVVQGQQARVLDPRGEGPAPATRYAPGHAAISSSASKCACWRRARPRRPAGTVAPRAPPRNWVRPAAGGTRPFGIRAEGEDSRAGGIAPRRPRMQFRQAPVKGQPGRSASAGSKCAAANTRSQSAAAARIRARSRAKSSSARSPHPAPAHRRRSPSASSSESPVAGRGVGGVVVNCVAPGVVIGRTRARR